MTTATTTPPPSAAGSPISRRISNYDFLLRRLHSLSGILPIGLFVIGHLFTNAQMAFPDKGETFQHEVDFIHSIPGLLIIEMTLWASIAFHAVVGVWITMTGRSNTSKYLYGANIRYTLQRVTGIVAIVFIFLHVATLRWRWPVFDWFTPFYAHHQMNTDAVAELSHDHTGVPMSMPLTAYALQISWLVVALYFVGVISSVFHWCNGLWTAAITWGLTISRASMRRWGYVCAGLFVALMVFFLAAMWGALSYDIGQDTSDEQLAAFFDIVPEPKIEIDIAGRGSR